MEEENTLYDRIGEADLNPNYKDGQVYQHTDINNMLSILKTAINENYYDGYHHTQEARQISPSGISLRIGIEW